MTLRLCEQIDIDRPPADVWDRVSRLDEEQRWRRPYVTDLETTGDPLEPGTRIFGTTRAFGQTETYRNEVTEVVPPRRLAWKGPEASGALLGTRGSYELEPRAGGTRFTLKMQYDAQGFCGRLQAPLLAFVLRRIARRFLRQLEDLAESGRAENAPRSG